MTVYKCRCHVCGRDFDHEAHFMSVPASAADGRLLVACNVEETLPKHTQAEIKAAYLRRFAA
jgi:hypothetical protein